MPVVHRDEETEPLQQHYDHAHYVAEAEHAYFHGDYRKALRIYSRAIQADHSQVVPWVGQVMCLIELHQFREATVWVKRALEMFPEDARILSIQGAVYANMGMAQRAIGSSDYALARNATDPLVWVLRGEILSLADNQNSAFCFQKAIETKQADDWHTPMQVGLILIRQRKWAAAADYLKMAVQLHTGNGFLWTSLGRAHEQLGLSQAALDAYTAALSLNPNDLVAEKGIASVVHASFIKRLWRRIFR
jgi:tetratricopeptide (TPR) repeat protein